MSALRVVKIDRMGVWNSVLKSLGKYDFYHTADYHLAELLHQEGEPELLVFGADERLVAIPLFIRKAGIGADGKMLFDATSVYGYVGCLGAEDANLDLTNAMRKELHQYWRARRIVSVFSRMHPLLGCCQKIGGDVLEVGKTLAVDLTQGEHAYELGLARGHRYWIKKLKKCGCSVTRVDSSEWLECFHGMYTATMKRLGARESYYYSLEYFKRFFDSNSYCASLYKAEMAGEVCAMSIFVRCNDIVQYHLSCSSDGLAGKYPATKLIVDHVIRESMVQGARVLHLGGGLGGQEDSLYQFKLDFGSEPKPFSVWKYILDEEAYGFLCQQAGVSGEERVNHFPAYRYRNT